MAFVLNDRVKETTTSTGTGTINLAGAETGFETFVAGVGNSNTCYYCIAHQSANEFEVGLGTVTDATPDTLARTTIISSSNSDSAVDFSAGTKDVFCTLPASKAVAIPGSGDLNVDVPGTIILDSSQNVNLYANGTHFAYLQNENSDFRIGPIIQDKDFIVRGNDGGTYIDGLTIDFSEAANVKVESGSLLMETAGKYFQVAGSSSTFWAIGSSGGSNPPGTASTTLAFHHWDGSAWNNEVEFNSSGDITLDGATYGGVNVPANRDIALNAGTWTGEKSYKIQAHSGNLYLQSDYFFFRDAGGTNNASIDSSGNAIFLNNVTAYGSPSDIKLKEDIEVIDNAIDKVKQLKGITYTLKSDGNRLTGLIAQDLEKVLPEAVYTSETIPDEINGIEAEEHLAIRYGNTVGLLVEAIKEQQEQIETLAAKVKELEDK